jgi:hypothetical protein
MKINVFFFFLFLFFVNFVFNVVVLLVEALLED